MGEWDGGTHVYNLKMKCVTGVAPEATNETRVRAYRPTPQVTSSSGILNVIEYQDPALLLKVTKELLLTLGNDADP